MKGFLALLCLFLASCASAQAEQAPLTTQANFPIVCLRPEVFNSVTGPRNEIMEFNDVIGNVEMVVHVVQFVDVDGHLTTMIYHTYPNIPNLVCVLHASPNS